MVNKLKDLRWYLSFLEERGKLVKVKNELSPILEIPTILREVMYKKGPAVLFESIKDFPGWRIVGNLFVDLDTLKQALEVTRLEEIGITLVEFATRPLPMGFFEKVKSLGELTKLSKFIPKKVGKAQFKKNVLRGEDDPLDQIPAFKTWPKDGGRYLTYPLVITKDPEKGVYNMGVYRVMILDGTKGVIHWQIHKRGAKAHFDYWRKGEEEIPVAIAIGSDIGTLLTGATPVPYPLDKYLFAGAVRGEGLNLFELENGLLVPANAEIVLEGYVRPDELHEEGPFGDHFGFYDKPIEKYPIFYVEKMYHRENPIYYGSVVGKPELEDAVIGKAVERIFLPILRVLLPEIVEINLPPHGVFQGLMIVSIKKRYPGQAKKVMMALWGLGQTSLTKIIIVVDETVNPHDINQVIWAVSSNVDPQRDVVIIPNTHTDALDPASKAPSYGSKLGIDATKKFKSENYGKEWPEEVEEDEEILEKVKDVISQIIGDKNGGSKESLGSGRS